MKFTLLLATFGKFFIMSRTPITYSESTVLRIIRHIPIIISNFKSGVNIDLLAMQMESSPEVIEQIIRLGFSIKLNNIKKVILPDDES